MDGFFVKKIGTSVFYRKIVVFRRAGTPNTTAPPARQQSGKALLRWTAVGEDLGEENASRPFLTDERAPISSAAIPARALS